ncbi:ATP-binding protein [Shewanella metallivivens]|uniref:histidine kinase n=1 Tax=Shewanella metallivivens TaxID=2872342 RepID=A0ABT5TK13_9GAMM|nr:ATP-binding protein [Shewanella metallivivens]MDD8058518.1 ATP-binding protein [Shewanella metallivivens]
MSKINWWRSLRAQSFLAVFSFGLMLICLFVFYTLPEQARWVNDGLSKTAQRSLQQLSTSITTPLLTRQYAELYEQINNQLEIHPNWKAIKIVDAETGNQLYPLDSWVGAFESGDMLLSQDIIFLDKPLATITLVVNFTAEINESSKLHYTLIYIQFSILLLILVGLAWLVDYRITSPLRALEHAFTRLAKGDFDCHVDKQQHNEVGSVINGFNQMVNEVAGSQQKLNSLRIQAESASKAKSDFMASMSHELRTPLNAILGLSQLYDYDQSASQIQKNNAKSIYRAGEHLLLLINDVLDMTAIESGNMQFNFEYVPIKRVIEESVELVTELINAQSISLHLEGLNNLEGLCFYVDERRFKQIMLNLLSNAIKYNKPQGKIYIRCSELNNNQCRISVADTGYGLTDDEESRLFKPFDRLGAETSEINGTGIGLVITRELVERMQGEITVQSEVNQGSCFSLLFNSFEQSNKTTNTQFPNDNALHTEVDALPILNVLVAEDQVTNQQVLKQQLTLLGVQSTFVSNGEQAWQILQDIPFDVLLTDIQMPLLDGLGLTKRIRQDDRYNALVIIAVTANIIKENIDDCYAAGMNGFLTKPVELVQLKTLLIEHSSITINAPIEQEHSSASMNDKFAQLDIGLLVSMLGEDTDVHCMVFNAFIQSAGEQVKLINAYTESENYVDLSFQSHGLKSASKSIAALGLADICQQIESLANINSINEQLIIDLNLCFESVMADLKYYCRQHEAP